MLSPTLSHAIATLAHDTPALADRAATALNCILQRLQASPWQDVAWSFSELTGDGFPVEFTFSNRNHEIRYATEIAGPEVAEVDRLHKAIQLLETLGAPKLPDSLHLLFQQIQSAGNLRYGLWLGGRHRMQQEENERQLGDRYKLYIEVPQPAPPIAEQFVASLLGQAPLFPDLPLSLLMIGYELYSGQTEFYFRVENLQVWEVEMLLGRIKLSSRTQELIDFMEQICDRPLSHLLSGASFGVSIALSSQGTPLAFSLFAAARNLFGSDRNIRQTLLSRARQQGWNLEQYATFTELLTQQTSWTTHHGILSFVVPLQGNLELHIGVRPPQLEES